MQPDEEANFKMENSKAVIYIPCVPPALLNWKLLKNHFSQFGNVERVNIHPHQRTATVAFQTEDEAKYAKENGSVCHGKALTIQFYSSDVSSRLDPRASGGSVHYTEFEESWEDVDMDSFGVEQRAKKLKSTNMEKLVAPKVTRIRKPVKSTVKESAEEKVKRKIVSKKISSESLDVFNPVVRKRVSKVKSKIGLSKSPREVDCLVSLKDKLALLEERDKMIRKSFVKTSNVKLANVVIGTCPDMCPEKERIMREYQRLVSVYEMYPDSQNMDPSLAVKAYSRSSADQEEPLPHELRPEPVLSMTMGHIITNIMMLIERDPDVNISDWYDFCWDRLRGIRKDIIQQQLCDLETVAIIEQCARFHIVCYDRLWGIDRRVFDEKINTENLMNCLQSLRHMYEDLAKENIKCPNEAEFNTYMILLNMRTGDLISEYQQFSPELQMEQAIQFAVKVYLAFNNSMYSQFFKLVKQSSYLNACLLQRYFNHVRVLAIQAIARAYCPPKNNGSIPLLEIMRALKFDDPEDAKLFCESHGFILKDKGYFEISRNDFYFPETPVKINVSSSLVISKRLSISKAVIGPGGELTTYKKHRVHSSFTADGKLTDLAVDASDQKATVVEPTKENITEEDPEEVMKEIMTVEDVEDSSWRDESFSMEVDEFVDSGDGMERTEEKKIQDSPKKEFEPIKAFKFNIEQVSPKVQDAGEKIIEASFRFAKSQVQQQPQGLFSGFKSSSNENLRKFSLSQLSSVETSETGRNLLTQPFSFGGNSKQNIDETLAKPIGTSGFTWGPVGSGSKLMEDKKVEVAEMERRDIENQKCDALAPEPEETDSGQGFMETGSLPVGVEEDKSDVVATSIEVVDVNKDESRRKKEVKRESPKIKTKSGKYLTVRELKKSLPQRVKLVRARLFTRKWRHIVKKMKERRKDLPFLEFVPIDRHLSLWGSVRLVPESILHRLQDKRRCVKTTCSVLGDKIQNSVPFLGPEIVRNIVFNSPAGLIDFKDFNIPPCWKLAISIPFNADDDGFLVDKFNNWITKVFYGSKRTLGSVVRMNSSFYDSVYYCIQTVIGDDLKNQQSKLAGISGLLFISVDGSESTSVRNNRLQKLIERKNVKELPVVVINIGRKDKDQMLCHLLDKNKKIGRVSRWHEEYWKDFSSVLTCLKFLTTNVNLSTEIKANTLASVLERLTESIFSVMTRQIDESVAELSVFLKNPCNIIKLYNHSVKTLALILSNDQYTVNSVVPPEFREFVQVVVKSPKKNDTLLCKSRIQRVNAALDKVQLPVLSDWPPSTSEQLVETLISYCSSLDCHSVLPQLVRVINLQDDTDLKSHLSTVPWVSIVDMLVQRLIKRDFVELKSLVVLYNESLLSDLCDINQCYDTLHKFVIGSLR